MKNCIAFILCLLISSQIMLGQMLETTPESPPYVSYDFHMTKHRKNKTAAWICLGGGVLMTTVGLVINTGDEAAEILGTALTLGLVDVEAEPVHDGDWLIYGGSAVAAASIPFFIHASKHRKKAELTIKTKKIAFSNKKNQLPVYPSVGVTIEF